MRFFIFILSFIILSGAVFAQEPQPVWSKLGLLINDTPGNTAQENPKVISDGAGGYIVVWEDSRGGYSNIYAQRISDAGSLVWRRDGLATGPISKNQNFPQIVSDQAGGAIIVWQDYRNGNADIYAQRLSYAGASLWGKTGIAVCTAGAGQFAPAVAADSQGGAIITWHDYRSGKGEDIYTQRINSNGKALWQDNGLPVVTASGTQWYPRIAEDGTGGAIIVWSDGRFSSSNNNIYAQRVESSGHLSWQKDGVPVCSAPNNQEHPVIISLPGEGIIIAWDDTRFNNIDIFAQKIDLEGNILWLKDGIAACSLDYSQENPKLAPDGAGGAVLVWSDQRTENTKIYAQRIDRNGRITWSETGRPVCKSSGNQRNPVISKLINQEWVVVWEDNRKSKSDLFAQKINVAGIPLWQPSGIPVTSAPQQQQSPSVTSTPGGNLVILWEDKRSGNYDIYSQKISEKGTLLWGKTGLSICTAKGSVAQQNAASILTSQGEIILAFEDARSGYFNIYVQKITKQGRLAWGAHGVAIAKVAANQFKPQLVSDGAGGAIVAWEDQRLENLPSIRAQRISSQGNKTWQSSLALASVKARQTNPIIIEDGAGGAIIAWEDARDPLSLQDIYVQKVSSRGKLVWGKNGIVLISANGVQTDPAMTADGLGGTIVVWTDYRHGDRNPDIFGQRISSKGKPSWDPAGLSICSAPDIQRSPKLIADDKGGAVIAWTDKGGGSYDIYAQRITQAGQPLWMKDGIPINQLSRTQQNPLFGNKNILVWEDYRLGNWDIFASAVSLDGRLLWGEAGIPVSQISHTQYDPQVISWTENSAIVAWEDYRSGQNYEIYFQKITQAGQLAWAENGLKMQSGDGAKVSELVASLANNNLYIFWEDFTGGGRAIYGQKYLVN
ncbi:hypothetical protein ACFL31_02555 [Candidatus Margulisiibacteriota bacterium]